MLKAQERIKELSTRRDNEEFAEMCERLRKDCVNHYSDMIHTISTLDALNIEDLDSDQISATFAMLYIASDKDPHMYASMLEDYLTIFTKTLRDNIMMVIKTS